MTRGNKMSEAKGKLRTSFERGGERVCPQNSHSSSVCLQTVTALCTTNKSVVYRIFATFVVVDDS